MTAREMMWLAGWLEGEGSFSVHRSRPKGPDTKVYFYPKIQASSTDVDIIERVKDMVGCGSIYGPRPVSKSTHNPIYIYRVVGKPARTLMIRILPHMGRRRTERILEVLAACNES
jgi:hypothetical protein